MSFISPAALGLSIILPIIIAMYFLKLRRMERTVSSIYLWEQIIRDLEANTPWQRLRNNLLLILQLLFLIVLIFAIARPFSWTEGASGLSLIIILDTSASMAAIDVQPNRIEEAKNQAYRLVEELPKGALVTVIEAGEKPAVKISSSNDLKNIRQAIQNIRAGTSGCNLGVAIQLASAIASRQIDAQIIVLSDGNVTLPARSSVNGKVSYMPIGVSDENQAIELLSLQAIPGSNSLAAFAQIVNYSDMDVERRIAIYSDGNMSGVYDLDLPPNGEQSVLLEELPIETNHVEARLLSNDQTKDYLPIDDRAVTIHRQTDPYTVTLITQGNIFLETALTLLPGLSINSITPEEATSFPNSELVILDNYVPITTSLPAGNLLFIAPPQSTQYFVTDGAIPSPIPRASDSSSKILPLITYVNLDEVNILDSVRINLPTWAQPVIVSDDIERGGGEIPLLFIGENDGRRIAVLSFDLHHSDLPLQVAFPILLANLIQWLTPGQGGNVPIQVASGSAVAFSIPPGSLLIDESHLTIIRPDGSVMRLETSDGQVIFSDTNQLGLYKINMGNDQSFEFVVNLFSPQESSIRPNQSLSIVGTNSSEETSGTFRSRREWWRWGVAFALIFLILEWLVYNRSTLTLLYKRISFFQKKTSST